MSGSQLDKRLSDAIKSIPECLAGAYIDMSTGMLLAVKTIDSHPQEVLDLVAAATADLFQGPSVLTIEEHFKRARGTEKDDSHYFQEFLVMSENLIHVFMRAKTNQDHAIVFVSRRSANIGMLLAKSRAAAPTLSAAM